MLLRQYTSDSSANQSGQKNPRPLQCPQHRLAAAPQFRHVAHQPWRNLFLPRHPVEVHVQLLEFLPTGFVPFCQLLHIDMIGVKFVTKFFDGFRFFCCHVCLPISTRTSAMLLVRTDLYRVLTKYVGTLVTPFFRANSGCSSMSMIRTSTPAT